MSRSKRAAREQKKAEQERLRKARQRRQRVLIGIGTVAVAGVFALLIAASLGGSSSDALTGDTTATGWDLPALDDTSERVTLADFSGTPTVAVFFASWCEVCEVEMPEFIALADQLGDAVSFVGINSQDNGRGGGDAAKWGITERWPLARDIGLGDGRGLSAGTFGARGMPLTVVYDGTGAVVHIQRGGINASGLLSILQSNALV